MDRNANKGILFYRSTGIMNKLEIIVNTLISSTETEADRKWRLK